MLKMESKNTTSLKMAGIALKGQCGFVTIMVHPGVSLKEKCSQRKSRGSDEDANT